MSTVLFYRVEDSTNTGPYNCAYSTRTDALFKMSSVHCDWDHPTPHEEDLDFSRDMVYGFSTLEQMLDWFKGYGHVLDDAGFRVSVYRVGAQWVESGKYQAVVKLDRLTDLVETFSTCGL